MEETTVGLKFQPAEEYVVSDLDTLKVLADPLRLTIIEYLNKPGTVKQIAEKIDKPPTKLYYHFNLLEKHGLIQMVDTRIVSGIVEKHYQASAKSYRAEHTLLSTQADTFDETLDMTLNGLFGDIREDLNASLRAGVAATTDNAPRHRKVLMTGGRLAMRPDRAEEFYDRLYKLIQEFDDDESGEDIPEALTYKLVLLVHPLLHRDKDDET